MEMNTEVRHAALNPSRWTICARGRAPLGPGKLLKTAPLWR